MKNSERNTTYQRSEPYRIADDEWACKLIVKRKSDGQTLIEQEIYGATREQAYQLAGVVGESAGSIE